MKKSLKKFAKFMLIFAVTFVLIYLLVFVGGWKLFESQDPILMEIGISILVAIVLYIMDHLYANCNDRIEKLEKRIDELESLLNAKDKF